MRIRNIVAGTLATAALTIGLAATPAQAGAQSERAELKYHTSTGSSKAWKSAGKSERRHVKHAFADARDGKTCAADRRHAYQDRSKRKDKDGIVKGLPVVQVKHAGQWYRFAEYSDGICGD